MNGVQAKNSEILHSPGLNGQASNLYKIKSEDGVIVCTPNDSSILTPYVLQEQGQWYEPELKFVWEYLKPGMNVVDVGAGFGVYALPAAKRIGPGGRVYAFEPGSVARHHMEMSKLENRLPNLEIIGKAVGLQSNSVNLKIADTPELNTVDSGGNETVRQTTLDAWWEFEGQPKIDLIKLDVNGSEDRVLLGAEQMLKDISPVILLALGNSKKDNNLAIAKLNEQGYHMYEYVPGPRVLTPYERHKVRDSYLMNLIAINQDQKQAIEQSGWLHDEAVEPETPPMDLWKQILGELPWTTSISDDWEQISGSLWHKKYLQALDYLCAAEQLDLNDANNPTRRSEKATLMLRAAGLLIDLYNNGRNSFPIAFTLARVLYALGRRGQAVDILKQVMERNELSKANVNPDLPFLPPLPEQDRVPLHTNLTKWLTVRLSEAWVLLKHTTTYWSEKEAKQLLQVLKGSPESFLNNKINEETGKRKRIQSLSENGHQSSTRNYIYQNLRKVCYLAPGKADAANGIHNRKARLLTELTQREGIPAEVLYVTDPQFIQKVVEISKDPGHAIDSGAMGYPSWVSIDRVQSANLFDLLNANMFAMLGDHLFATFMWHRLVRIGSKTTFYSCDATILNELKCFGPHETQSSFVLDYTPPFPPNDLAKIRPFNDREIDLLIPWTLDPSLSDKDRVFEELSKMGTSVVKVGKALIEVYRELYDEPILPIFFNTYESIHGQAYRFNKNKTKEDYKWMNMLYVIDQHIRHWRRYKLLEEVSKLATSLKIVITQEKRDSVAHQKILLDTNIEWIGRVTTEQLDSLYGNSKMVLSCNPTFPNLLHRRIKDSMQMGCCVITDKIPGLSSRFTNKEHLLFINEENELDDLLLQRTSRIKEIAQNGERLFAMKYTPQNSCHMLLKKMDQQLSSNNN